MTYEPVVAQAPFDLLLIGRKDGRAYRAQVLAPVTETEQVSARQWQIAQDRLTGDVVVLLNTRQQLGGILPVALFQQYAETKDGVLTLQAAKQTPEGTVAEVIQRLGAVSSFGAPPTTPPAASAGQH